MAEQPVVLNPEAIGDPERTPVVRVGDVDDCPMHSPGWLYAAVRNNRRLAELPPQACSGCGEATS